MKKAFALILVLALFASLFVGCGDDKNNSRKPDKDDDVPVSDNTTIPTTIPTTPSTPNNPSQPVIKHTASSTALEMLSRVEEEDFLCYYLGNAYVSRVDSKQYAIKSTDQSKVIDGTFVSVDRVNDHIVAKRNSAKDIYDFENINSTGVYNQNLDLVVDHEYAVIKSAHPDGCVIAYKATEVTTNKDEALVYLSNDYFPTGGDEDDTYYKAEWCVINLKTGEKLPGLGGTYPPDLSANSNYIRSETPDGEIIHVDLDGNIFPSDAKILGNGCYVYEDTKTVYASDGTFLFTYTGTYPPSVASEKYFQISRYVNGNNEYYLVDRSGNVVSAIFPKHMTVYFDRLIKCDEKLYYFDGTQIYDDKIYNINQVGNYYLFRDYNKNYWITDLDLNVIARQSGNDVEFSYSDLVFYKPGTSYKYLYYSVPQQAYVYEGSSIAPWLVQISRQEGYTTTYDVVNTLTDEYILSGCTTRPTVYIDADDNIYISVQDETVTTFYRVK